MAEEVANMPYLPDDMIREIFLRLPPKLLGRLRALCPAWRDLASEPYLLDAHHRRQPADLLIYRLTAAYERPLDSLNCIDFAVDAVDFHRADRSRPVVVFTEPTDPLEGSELEIHGCCGGLLLISFSDILACTLRLDLCNPTTRQWARIQWNDIYRIAGLYRHGPSGDYRVLYHHNLGVNKKSYRIFSMSSGERKCIDKEESDADVVAWLNRGPNPACWSPPVLLRGNLHWPPQLGERNTMLVFDTVAETFRCIPTTFVQPGSQSSLFDMDGTLAMSISKNVEKHRELLELWLLPDYEMKTWVRSHRFEFTRGGSYDSFVVSLQGDVLLDCTDRLLFYDAGWNLLRAVQGAQFLRPVNFRFTRFLLKESIVRQPFLQNYAIDDDAAPPYFRGPWP